MTSPIWWLEKLCFSFLLYFHLLCIAYVCIYRFFDIFKNILSPYSAQQCNSQRCFAPQVLEGHLTSPVSRHECERKLALPSSIESLRKRSCIRIDHNRYFRNHTLGYTCRQPWQIVSKLVYFIVKIAGVT